MRFLGLAVIGFCLLAVTGGCKKPAPCTLSYNDNSFTRTDTNGAIIGVADPNDWTKDSTWNACENALFNFSDTFNYAGLTSTSIKVVPAYPNPFSSVIDFVALDTGTNIVKLVIVDDNLNVIGQNTLPTIRAEALQPSGLDTNAHYRLYYRFYGNNKTVIYQGHGDLRTN